MFGYVKPLKNELKIREFEIYNAYYCAVCRAVGRRYGSLPRLMLSYDAAFMALLGSAIGADGLKPSVKTFRCLNNPTKKRNEALPSPLTDYVADVMVLLGYLGIKDKKTDGDAGGFAKRSAAGAGELLLRSAGRKACERIPEQALEVYSCISMQAELEAEKSSDIDEVADLTGRFMSVLTDFTAVPGLCEELKKDEVKASETSELLRKLGYHLGRFIYVIDAIDDLEKDRESGAYNPLLLREISKESLELSLSLDLANIAESAGRLNLLYHKSIIENIIYLGLNAVKDEVFANPGGKSYSPNAFALISSTVG